MKHQTQLNDVKNNALLFFENGLTLNVYAQGKHGIFSGFLTVVDGIFSIKELQEYASAFQIFTTNNSIVKIDDIDKKPHLVVMAQEFEINTKKNINNLTLVSNFTPESVSFLKNKDDHFEKINNIKCVLFFPDDITTMNANDVVEINNKLNDMPSELYKFDYTKIYQNFKPYRLTNLSYNDFYFFKKMPIFQERKKVAIIDFLTPYSLLKILQKYFSLSVLPYKETYKHIKYLYNDNKIDAVIIPDFVGNTYFLKKDIINNIKQLLESKIPVLGIGNGAILIAETLSSQTQINQKTYSIDNFIIINNDKKQFVVSNFCNKNITSLSASLTCEYYDTKANIVGFAQRQLNVLGYTFSFLTNNSDTAFFLNEFYKIIKNANKRRK